MVINRTPVSCHGDLLKIAVLAKAVPDVKNVRLTMKENDIDTADLNFLINEQDSYALEEGLKLKEKFGGEVIVITAGGESRRKGMTQVVRECYAKGADRGIMIVDEAFQKLDDLARARVFSSLLMQEKPDVVICGSQSFDTATSRMGPMVAEFMGIPHASLITGLEPLEGGKAFRLSRDLEQGVQEILQIGAPCLLTTQTGINTPRYAALSKIIMATRKEIRTVSVQETGVAQGDIGKLDLVKVVSAGFPEEKASNVLILKGTPDEEAAQLVRSLREKGLLQR